MRAPLTVTLCLSLLTSLPILAQKPPSLAGYRLGDLKSKVARSLPCTADSPRSAFCNDLSQGQDIQLWFVDGRLHNILTRERYPSPGGDSLNVYALSAFWLDNARAKAIKEFGEPDSVQNDIGSVVLAVWDNGYAELNNAPPVPRSWNAKVCVMNDRFLRPDGTPEPTWHVLVIRFLTAGHGLGSPC